MLYSLNCTELTTSSSAWTLNITNSVIHTSELEVEEWESVRLGCQRGVDDRNFTPKAFQPISVTLQRLFPWRRSWTDTLALFWAVPGKPSLNCGYWLKNRNSTARVTADIKKIGLFLLTFLNSMSLCWQFCQIWEAYHGSFEGETIKISKHCSQTKDDIARIMNRIAIVAAESSDNEDDSEDGACIKFFPDVDMRFV